MQSFMSLSISWLQYLFINPEELLFICLYAVVLSHTRLNTFILPDIEQV